jgi:hypothetical protein
MATKITREILEYKNSTYRKFENDWEMYGVVYDGGSALINYALQRNPRESQKNFEARVADGFAFNDGKTIISLFNFYMNQKEPTRELGSLSTFDPWELFLKDADLHGTDYNNLINEAHKFASAYGAIGILVNKPYSAGPTIQTDIDSKIYPYYSLYLLPNIYDWTFEKDPRTHRQVLTYLKLKESDGTYTLWYRTSWQQWGLAAKTGKPVMISQGENPLGEIPFVWMQNIRDLKNPTVGSSDLADIGHIVCSIVRNLSCGEEIIKFAGFPIMRRPMEREGEYREATNEIPVGVTAVEEFDSSMGAHAKADWMPTEILEPIEAILKWMDKKADEIDSLAHVTGIRGQRTAGSGSGGQVGSGLALRFHFSQLNSVLLAKTKNLNEAEYQLLRLWLKWQNKEDSINGVQIVRTTEFSIDDLAVALDNAIKAMGTVKSKRFRELVQDKIVKTTTPDITQKDIKQISSEIFANTPDGGDPMDLPGQKGGMQEKFRTAANAVKDTSPKQGASDV